MKARIPIKNTGKILMSYDEVRQTVEEEFAKKQYELYSEAVQDITVQVMANVLKTLEVWYGWKESRLKKFVQSMHGYEEDMVRFGITTNDNFTDIKEKYNIDLAEEFPAHVKQHKAGEPDEVFKHFTKEVR